MDHKTLSVLRKRAVARASLTGVAEFLEAHFRAIFAGWRRTALAENRVSVWTSGGRPAQGVPHELRAFTLLPDPDMRVPEVRDRHRLVFESRKAQSQQADRLQ